MDNELAASQLAIGESSNLAQLALTYMHTYGDEKYKDYSCILASIAQDAIDSSKRTFDIDIPSEITRIRGELGIDEHLLPKFWQATSIRGIKKQFKNNTLQSKQIQKIRNKINPELHCPMNKAYEINPPHIEDTTETLGMIEFFERVPSAVNIKVNKRIENLIERFGLDIYNERSELCISESSHYLLFQNNFEEMVEEIRRSVIPSKYVGLFSWLIDRAFIITPPIIRNKSKLSSILNKNRPLLLKTLFTVNSEALLKCFAKKINKK